MIPNSVRDEFVKKVDFERNGLTSEELSAEVAAGDMTATCGKSTLKVMVLLSPSLTVVQVETKRSQEKEDERLRVRGCVCACCRHGLVCAMIDMQK